MYGSHFSLKKEKERKTKKILIGQSLGGLDFFFFFFFFFDGVCGLRSETSTHIQGFFSLKKTNKQTNKRNKNKNKNKNKKTKTKQK